MSEPFLSKILWILLIDPPSVSARLTVVFYASKAGTISISKWFISKLVAICKGTFND